MDELGLVVPGLPIYVQIPLTLLCLAILLYAIKRTPSLPGRFMVAAIGLRFILSALHEYTFKSSPIGLSYNAIVSIGLVAIGFLCIKRRSPFSTPLLAVYPLIFAIVMSGLVNRVPLDMVNNLTKLGYLVVIMLAFVDAARDIGAQRVLMNMLPPIATPYIFQLASILLGVAKAGEADGSQSFIGGFAHEAAFSVGLSIGALVFCFADRLRPSVRLPLIFWSIVAIFLANYRTTILGMLPMLGAAILLTVATQFRREQRGIITLFAGALILAGTFALFFVNSDRFADITMVFEHWHALFQPPASFTSEQRELLSGRSYIWSSYITAWNAAPPINQLFGFGPDQWPNYFGVYAHNTLVAYLFDLGIFGVLGALVLWTVMIGKALLNRRGPTIRLIATHIGFLVLNMATEPMWMVEGMMYYGLLCGLTVYYRSLTKEDQSDSRPLPAPLASRSVEVPAA